MEDIEQIFWSIPQGVKDALWEGAKTAAAGAASALCHKYVHGC